MMAGSTKDGRRRKLPNRLQSILICLATLFLLSNTPSIPQKAKQRPEPEAKALTSN